jgi:ankyrin repeat protein
MIGRTPLSWAAEKGHEDIVRLLLEKSADPNSTDRGGRTALSWATEKGHGVIVKLLLENNANTENRHDGIVKAASL